MISTPWRWLNGFKALGNRSAGTSEGNWMQGPVLCLKATWISKQGNCRAYGTSASACQERMKAKAQTAAGILSSSWIWPWSNPRFTSAFKKQKCKPWQKHLSAGSTIMLISRSVRGCLPSVPQADCILNRSNSDTAVSEESRRETTLPQCSSWQGINSKIIKRKQTGLVVWTRNFNFRSTIELGQHPVHNVYR